MASLKSPSTFQHNNSLHPLLLGEKFSSKDNDNIPQAAAGKQSIEETVATKDDQIENDHVEENTTAQIQSPEKPNHFSCDRPYNKETAGTLYPKNLSKLDASRNVNSNSSPAEPHDVAKDAAECCWYKPYITLDWATELLRNAKPGNFIIRKSTTCSSAYDLVMRIDKPPQGEVAIECLCHFLLETTHCGGGGVRLKGSTNDEPVFTTLTALVHQHSSNKLGLPCKLTFPVCDFQLSLGDGEELACDIEYLHYCNMASLTGDEAVIKGVKEMISKARWFSHTKVHFKVSPEGITLTFPADSTRRDLTIRRHYPSNLISHCAIYPDRKSLFAFIARPTIEAKNECHVFIAYETGPPASAIVLFVNKVLPMDKSNILCEKPPTDVCFQVLEWNPKGSGSKISQKQLQKQEKRESRSSWTALCKSFMEAIRFRRK